MYEYITEKSPFCVAFATRDFLIRQLLAHMCGLIQVKSLSSARSVQRDLVSQVILGFTRGPIPARDLFSVIFATNILDNLVTWQSICEVISRKKRMKLMVCDNYWPFFLVK